MHDADGESPGPIVLLHGDLKGEHILVSPTGAVTAVLDWYDACTGSPSIDIEGLIISVGAAAVIRIANGVGYYQKTCALGLLMARCNTLLRLDGRFNGSDEDSPLDLLTRQLQRAFETLS